MYIFILPIIPTIKPSSYVYSIWLRSSMRYSSKCYWWICWTMPQCIIQLQPIRRYTRTHDQLILDRYTISSLCFMIVTYSIIMKCYMGILPILSKPLWTHRHLTQQQSRTHFFPGIRVQHRMNWRRQALRTHLENLPKDFHLREINWFGSRSYLTFNKRIIIIISYHYFILIRISRQCVCVCRSYINASSKSSTVKTNSTSCMYEIF